MSSFEFNKLFAAVLVAGIVAMLSGFIAKQAVHPENLVKEAVAIEGASEEGDHGSSQAADKPPEPIMALLASADIEKGAKLSKACAACHSFEKGGPAKQGPNLWGIVNRDKGSADFEYSQTCKEMPGNWDYDSLNHFLTKPKKYIPGTKMNFVGLKKPEDRAAIIAWLRTLADSPPALPTEAEIAAEQAASAPPAETATAPTEAAPPADGATPPETAPAEGQPAETPAENPAEKTEAPLEPVQKATAH